MKTYNDYILNINELKKNVSNIRNFITENTKFCAIVKADAYGLGVENVCKAIKDKVDFFGVACIVEALAIRKFDKETNILVLGVTSPEHYSICEKLGISITISSLEHLQELIKSKNKCRIHLKINTGMNRFGISKLSELKKCLKLIEDNKLILEGVFSHFATKKNDIGFLKKQYYKFLQFKSIVRNKNVIFHISNSYGTTFEGIKNLDMVRCGNLMYGITENEIKNKCVLTIKSKIVAVHRIKKGESVGYDRSFIAVKRMKIAIVPLGYADGIDRRLSNNFYVLVNGIKCKIIGYICMDALIIDISNLDANVGSEVVLLGKQKNEKITLTDYAKALNTSPYEVMLKFKYKRMNCIIKE